ncbi:hypothetical protein D1007_21011 [Hordeum vulgare]|nr:hypothetical protein D1007_21011 [Hordeum vulgare]KAI4995775.1 hypothetical protein ZWY2020_037823 [Hordeum vulgare]
MVHYPPLARSRFPGETWTHGDPDLRLEWGDNIISRTRGMDTLEADFHGHTLLAMVWGRRFVVSPKVMVRAMSAQCGVDRSQVCVEVTHLMHFFITFASMEICDCVFACSGQFRCGGELVGF